MYDILVPIIFLVKKQNNRFCIILFCCLLICSCSRKTFSIHEIESSPSYLITNDNISVIVNDLEEEYKNDVRKDVYIIYFEKIENDSISFDICKTNFDLFKTHHNRMYYFKRLKGYAMINNLPILIFGDINNDVLKKIGKIKNILQTENKKPVPSIYEPNFKKYYLHLN